jgi:hypothetical protein
LFFSARPELVDFNAARREIFERMNLLRVAKKDWFDEFRTLLGVNEAKDALIKRIEEIAKENAVTAGVVYMSVAGDYGLTSDDIKHIRGWHYDVEGNARVSINLVDFVEEWEDDLLEIHQDSLHRSSPTSESELDAYVIDSYVRMAETMPEYDPNPVKTRSWNIGFIRAMLGDADRPQAEEAALDAWRLAMDPKAAEEYSKALKATDGNRKAAMAAFWRKCDRRVPRPQEAIAFVRRDGLKLESGRVIDWKITELKIKNNELKLDGDIKSRLLAKLQELGAGQQIWGLLK